MASILHYVGHSASNLASGMDHCRWLRRVSFACLFLGWSKKFSGLYSNPRVRLTLLTCSG
jgi:hypothetical protein